MRLQIVARTLLSMMIASGLVSASDLNRIMDQALEKGWHPVREADAPPAAPASLQPSDPAQISQIRSDTRE
jgi:hypothetical protein